MNKDWENIKNNMITNWVSNYIWQSKWIEKIIKFDYLEHEHLWPDLIWLSPNTIYWFEHFYVDSSERKKWSKLKIEIKNNNNYLEEKLKKEKETIHSYKFNTSLNYNQLIDNTYYHFEKHYKNINTYKKNISKKYWIKKNIEIIFFIEYNILPSVFLINWKPEKYIYPFNDINFLKYFCKKKEIKWIIFSVDNKNYYIETRDKYEIDNKYIYDFSNWEIEDFEMNQATLCMKL